jgi:hypothetical protein
VVAGGGAGCAPGGRCHCPGGGWLTGGCHEAPAAGRIGWVGSVSPAA